MPPTIGCARRSRTSRPKRRVTNDAKLSSTTLRAGMNGSRAARARPAGLKMPARGERRNGSRCEEPEIRRNAAQPPAAHDPRAFETRGRLDCLRQQVQTQEHPLRGGLCCEQRIGPQFHEQAVALHCLDAPADAVGGLEQRNVQRRPCGSRQILKTQRSGQPAHAAADDRYARQARTASAKTPMNRGWSFSARARFIRTPCWRATSAAATSRS